jgi:hypothetical protein
LTDRPERCSIRANAFVIRFPNGDFEYDVTRRVTPSIGETVRRGGILWSVTRVNSGAVPTVHVERVAGSVGDRAADDLDCDNNPALRSDAANAASTGSDESGVR